MTDTLTDKSPYALAILRIVTALVFLQHGTQKILGFPAGEMPQPELLSLFGIGGVLELVGGVLLILGMFTRSTAFVMSGMMAVAYWMFHAPASVYPIQNGGELAIVFTFVFLYLVFSGPGAWSVDSVKKGSAAVTA